MSSHRSAKPAVTIPEVLVLITAIALLAALVVPAIGLEINAQRVTLCSKNLGRIAQGVIEYATQNDDWIVGSPSGSGGYLRYAPTAYGHAVQTWDFLGPLDHMWNPDTVLPAPGDVPAVVARFNMLRSKLEYLCPQNHFLAPRYSGPDAGIGPMVSYNTCRHQLWREEEAPSTAVHLPDGWRPSITAIGSPANKVFCADGARFSTTSIPPDYDLSVRNVWGGAFSDGGPFGLFSRSWDRGLAPGNGNPSGGDFDARFYAYRHGLVARNRNGDFLRASFDMNLAFYDGHVELQDDLTSTNPQQWLPAGSVFETQESCWPDTIAHFNLPSVVTIGD